MCCQHSSGSFYVLSLWEFGKGPLVLFFPSVTDTADYTFKLSLIMPIAIINQNMQAEVVFCEKAYHFTIRKAGTIEQGTSLEFSFGQREGR